MVHDDQDGAPSPPVGPVGRWYMMTRTGPHPRPSGRWAGGPVVHDDQDGAPQGGARATGPFLLTRAPLLSPATPRTDDTFPSRASPGRQGLFGARSGWAQGPPAQANNACNRKPSRRYAPRRTVKAVYLCATHNPGIGWRGRGSGWLQELLVSHILCHKARRIPTSCPKPRQYGCPRSQPRPYPSPHTAKAPAGPGPLGSQT